VLQKLIMIREFMMCQDTTTDNTFQDMLFVGNLGRRPRKDCPKERSSPTRRRLHYYQSGHPRPQSSFPCYHSHSVMDHEG
jgi:hypothetical protein